MSKIELIKIYNQAIVLATRTMAIWKNGNYPYKNLQIENCKQDIDFYKKMKNKLTKACGNK